MKRALCLLSVCLFCCAVASAQIPQFAQITSTSLEDGAGNKLNGTITFWPVTQSGAQIAPNLTGGGRAVPKSVTWNVVNGVITPTFGSAQLADVTQANPANYCYKDSIHDNVSGNTWTPDACVQPAWNASWCTYNSGAHTTTCNFDNYVPTGTPGALIQSGPPGIGADPNCHSDGIGNLKCGTVSAGGIPTGNVVRAGPVSSVPASWNFDWTSPTAALSSIGGQPLGTAVLLNPGNSQTIIQPYSKPLTLLVTGNSATPGNEGLIIQSNDTGAPTAALVLKTPSATSSSSRNFAFATNGDAAGHLDVCISSAASTDVSCGSVVGYWSAGGYTNSGRVLANSYASPGNSYGNTTEIDVIDTSTFGQPTLGLLGQSASATNSRSFALMPNGAALGELDVLMSSSNTGAPSLSNVPFAIRKTGIVISATQTTVTGTTAGAAVWSQPQQGSSFKQAVLYLNGYENTTGTAQTITLPASFATVAYVTTSGGSCTGVTISGTTLTLPSSMGATQTGLCEVRGY